MEEFKGITDSVIYGQFLIGVVQALLLGIGLFLLDVPKFLVLTFVAVILCIIPILGAWLVWLPGSIFLLATGQTTKGLILMVYGALFVSVVDNLLRPYFLSKRSRLPISISIIGIIGGMYAFGIVGILLGPLIMAYLIIIIDFYKEGRFNELFKSS